MDESVPEFARGFPDDPALAALVRAFVDGNYAQVRAGAAKLQAGAADDAVKSAARTLVDRTEADPLAKRLLLLTLALLVLLTAYWLVNDGPAPGADKRVPPPTIERISDTPPRPSSS